MIGATSLRMASYHHPILVTSNYGSESHWSWTRYAVARHPGTQLVRITPGERARAEDRAAWRQALEGRPDLQRRLIDGQPALIVDGQGVLEGLYNPEIHVSRGRLDYIQGNRLLLGHDAGLTPVTVVAQTNGSQVQILAGLASWRAGTEQHLTDLVIPWLARHAPEAELEHWVDPSMTTPSQADLALTPVRVIRQKLGGVVREGPVKWEPRRDPLVAMLGRLSGGRPTLVVAPGPDTALLRPAPGRRSWRTRSASACPWCRRVTSSSSRSRSPASSRITQSCASTSRACTRDPSRAG
jgi:hypothetical protein